MRQPRFEILRKLGQGGMGEVHLARDRELGREVALKVLTGGGLGSDDARARFLRESRLMAGIRHPGLLQVYDVVQDRERLVMVMEYVAGQDLEALIQDQGALPLPRVLRLARELGPALDALHARGILHRDIKPSNVMVREEGGEALLMDLGLAREEGGTVMTETGSLVGTPVFMPPEVVCGEAWEPAGDRFQLAAVLYRAATARFHVAAPDIARLFQRIADGDWDPFPVVPELPEWLREVLVEGLSRDPGARPVSGEELARRVEAALATPQGGSEGLSAPSTPTSRRVRRGAWAGLLMLGLLLGIGLRGHLGGGIRDLRWQVVGDLVEVRFRSPSRPEVSLEVAGVREGELLDQGGGEWALRLRVLGPGQEERARLLEGDSERASHWVRGQEPGLGLLPQPLLPGPRLGLRLVRPCRVALGPRSPELRDAGERSLEIRTPAGRPLPQVLAWEEEGVRFQKLLDWETLLGSVLDRIRGELRDVDPDRTLKASAPKVPGSPLGASRPRSFEAHRAVLREFRDWIPWMLAAPELPRGRRRELLALWQTWSRSVVQEVVQGLEGPPLLELTPGLPGALSAGEQGRGEVRILPLSPREESGDRGLGYLVLDNYLDGSTEILRRRRSTRTIDLSWPRREVAPGEWVVLSIRSESMEQWSQFELSDPRGDFRVSLWHPRPRPYRADLDFPEVVSLVLPADLAPDPGVPLELRARSLLSPQLMHGKVYRVAASWTAPPTPVVSRGTGEATPDPG